MSSSQSISSAFASVVKAALSHDGFSVDEASATVEMIRDSRMVELIAESLNTVEGALMDEGFSEAKIDAVMRLLNSLIVEPIEGTAANSNLTDEQQRGVKKADYYVAKSLKYKMLQSQPNKFLEIANAASRDHSKWLYGYPFVAITDLNPASHFHRLIIPFEHIPDCDELTPEHIPLLENMKTAADSLIREWAQNPDRVNDPRPPNVYRPEQLAQDADLVVDRYVMGFLPPPHNSVMQLHLHVMSIGLYTSKAQNTTDIHVNAFIPLKNMIDYLKDQRDSNTKYPIPYSQQSRSAFGAVSSMLPRRRSADRKQRK